MGTILSSLLCSVCTPLVLSIVPSNTRDSYGSNPPRAPLLHSTFCTSNKQPSTSRYNAMESSDNQNTRVNTKSFGSTSSAISSALETNLALQSELKRRLVQVRRQLLQNRTHAAEVTRSLSVCWKHHSYKCNANTQSMLVDSTCDESGKASNGTRGNINPGRRWTRHFFVDSDGSTPHDKSEYSATSTESCDEQHPIETKLQVAWSKSDITNLQRVVSEILEQNLSLNHDCGDKNHGGDPFIPWENNSFFQKVASELDINPPRSSVECRLALLTFADVDIVTAKFSKEESVFVFREVSQNQESVDWHELTCRLNSKFHTKPSRRTPWQCFQHYRSNLRGSKKCSAWTAEEDELLLKYIGAHGPQYVFSDSAIPLACKFFACREPKYVQSRAHGTLVNPNFVQDRWNSNEQKKLALLMRAYSDNNGAYPNPDHFPHRAQTRVAGKWDRSLDPSVSHVPFSDGEDKRLLAAVKTLGSSEGSFVSISKQFPDRTGEILWYRWTQLADKNDVVSKLSNRLIEKNFGGRGKKHLHGDVELVVQKKRLKTK